MSETAQGRIQDARDVRAHLTAPLTASYVIMDAARYTLPVRTRGLQAERRGSALGVAARVLPPHWNLTERWRARSPVATHRTQRLVPDAVGKETAQRQEQKPKQARKR